MKRTASRTKRAGNESHNVTESLVPGLSVSRWREFLEKEENDLFILGIREDIVNNCMRICYEKYLEKQAVAFTVHCAYLAWTKVIDVYYMHRDIGDTEDLIVRNSWEPDEEPEVSIIDSWGSQCIKAYIPEVVSDEEAEAEAEEVEEKKIEKKLTSSDEKSFPLPEEESLESMSFLSQVFEEMEREELNFSITPTVAETKSVVTSRAKSVFSKILSVSEEFLPLDRNTIRPCGSAIHKKK